MFSLSLMFSLLAVWKYSLGDETLWRCPTPDTLPDTTVILGFQDKCYQFVDREAFWTSAKNYCQLYGGRLVKVNDPQTSDFLVKSLNALPWSNKGVWIGLHDRNDESNWEWVSENGEFGETLQWTNWGRGHPRAFLHTMRDCIRMVRGRYSDWKWHETFCSALNWKYKYICEYRMEKPTPPAHSANFYQDNSEKKDMVFVPRPEHTDVDATTAKLQTTNKEISSEDYDYTAQQREDLQDLIKPLALREEAEENQRGITFVVLACTVGIVSAVVILIIIIVSRRRKRKDAEESTMKIENPMYDMTCDGNGSNNDSQCSRIQNEYVINIYSNPMPLAVRLLNAKQHQVAVQYDSPTVEVVKDEPVPPSGDGYEEPRKSHYLPMDGKGTSADSNERPQSNIYSEIPECYSENLYETLDEIHLRKNESDA